MAMKESDVESKEIVKLTREQAAIIGAYTGVLCGSFDALQEYVEKIMGRPVWTHEMGDKAVAEQIKEAARADFMALCTKD